MTEASRHEERANLEQLAIEQVLAQPVRLPVAWAVTSAEADGQPAVVLELRTPAGSGRYVLLRDGALAFASEVKRAAQRGPGLDVPPGGLVVPGR